MSVTDPFDPSQPDATGTLSNADFERVRGLIYKRAGIALNPSKRSLVFGRLSRRLRALGHADFKTYLDALERQPSEHPEWQEFINALTTNLTSFFRESHHFPILATHLQKIAARGAMKIWCAAASTGEEPVTIAITAMEALKSQRPQVSILATDIDTQVLATAERAVYSADSVAKVDPAILKQYFMRGSGANAGLVRVRPEVCSLIAYRPLNLLDGRWPIQARFDAIFCRNVMIYFDKDTQHRVLERLVAYLQPDGLLFVGHSENFAQARDLVEPQGKTVYRAVGSRAAAAA